MDIPWSGFLASSLLGSALSVRLVPEYTVSASYAKTFWVIFFVQILCAQVYRMIIWPFFLTPLWHLPSPNGATWYSGNFAEIRREPSGVPMARWVDEVPHDGLIYYRSIFNADRILLASPQAIGEVLVQKSYDFMKPEFFRGGIAQILGEGILLAEGDEHKRQRKEMSPAFAYRHVKDLYPDFWAKSRGLVHLITRELQSLTKSDTASEGIAPVLEVMAWTARATLDIIGSAGMGHEFDAIENPNNELATQYKQVFEPTGQARMLGLLSFFLPGGLIRALPVKRNDTIREAAATIKRICREIIQETNVRMTSEKKRTTKDIVSVAIESGGFSEENLVNQMMTFLAAGHETTATATTWAIYELCHHPDYQTRLREEIRANLPSLSSDSDVSAPITSEKLPFLHAVCNETLRFHPPVRLTIRETAKNTSILGTFIPKGTKIVIPILALNTSTHLWGPDAKSFNPNRWLTHQGKTKFNNTGGAASAYAYLTFLHGPRSCIGQQFAKAEFAAILAGLVGRFEMELEDKEREVKIQAGLTARPRGGLPVRMRVVEGW